VSGSPQSLPTPPSSTSDPSLVDHVFGMLLWRRPGERERRDAIRELDAGGTAAALAKRLIGSTEFSLLYSALEDGSVGLVRSVDEVEAILAGLGDEAFVSLTYDSVLGRPKDPSGGANYESELRQGASRTRVLMTLLLSEEFVRRYRVLRPQGGFVPRDTQLCELANPAKWDNPEWLDLMKSLVVVPHDKLSMHRKGYEFTQLLFGLTKLECLRPDARVLSVGAGHEPVLYWLANRVGKVVATDMYAGVWQKTGAMEGDARVITDPEDFAPFPYAAERLLFLQMNGRGLAFRDESFDVVYSLSSIEHFGGFEGAREAVGEMTRVLRPNGVLALATEYSLNGRPHEEVFQPVEVHRLLEHPRLRLTERIDESVWRRYDYVPVDLGVNPYQTPHMVVSAEGATFTSVMVFLRKA
jgi:SAM-dependent methyltransferase